MLGQPRVRKAGVLFASHKYSPLYRENIVPFSPFVKENNFFVLSGGLTDSSSSGCLEENTM
jgi:hypothetical protein